MKKVLLCLFYLLIFSLTAFAQATEQNSATWETYAFKEQNFSVALPRLPIVVESGNWLISEDTKRFGTYSNGVAYVVSRSQQLIIKSVKNKTLSQPPKSDEQKPFSEQNFQARLAEIRKRNLSEAKSVENGREVFNFNSDKAIYKIYYNPKDFSWIELWAIRPTEAKAGADKFFASFKLSANPSGKEVGSGASSVIGNAATIDSNNSDSSNTLGAPKKADSPQNGQAKSTKQNSGSSDVPYSIRSGSGGGNSSGNSNSKELPDKPKAVIEPLEIVLKSRANYTEEARKSDIQGTVLLLVTFSANGGINGVSVVKSLPLGLTEQAIAAARKLLFIPQKRDGVSVTVSKLVEYNFNLY